MLEYPELSLPYTFRLEPKLEPYLSAEGAPVPDRQPPHSQRDLFGSSSAEPRDLQIVRQRTAPLGKEQSKFNRLVSKLQDLRGQLAAWTAFEHRHRQRVLTELLPSVQQLQAVRRNLILCVAAILAGERGGPVSGKSERRKLRNWLLDLIGAQLEAAPDDREMIALHDRYADITFAEDQALDRELTRGLAEQMFDVELGDDVLSRSADEILAAAAKAAAAEEQRAEARRRARPKRRKAGEGAADAAQAARELSQSVRDVYRKLASALHPDRAADEAERVRRNELMQRVNRAYDKGDLLTLLTLQLEVEQIDVEHLAALSTERLAHYNAVLQGQVKEMERELSTVTMRFSLMLDTPGMPVTPTSVERSLAEEIAAVRAATEELRGQETMLLQPAARKRWLDDYARARREEERADAGFFAALDELVEAERGNGWGGPFPASDRPSKRRRKR